MFMIYRKVACEIMDLKNFRTMCIMADDVDEVRSDQYNDTRGV